MAPFSVFPTPARQPRSGIGGLHRLKLLSIFLVLAYSVVAMGEISLPDREPDLKVTEASALGQLSEGIGLEVGTSVPAFSLADHKGEATNREALLRQGAILVVFYRGGWCPYCNLQIRQMTRAFPRFAERGVTPVLISVDRPDAASLAQRTYEIPFPVLSDPELSAHEAFNVVMQLDEATRTRYAGAGLDLSEWSGREDGKIAVASAFLVDQEGMVQWSHADTDFRTRPSVAQLLDAIDSASATQ